MGWVESEPLEISVTRDETVVLEAVSSNPLFASSTRVSRYV